jgi:hypothetical protein
LVLNLEANMEYAQSFDWGREFRICGQAVRKKYPDYSHKHDHASYDDIVQEYAAADCVRVLREAPAPNVDQANQVSSLTEQLRVFQRAFEDYEESAFAADDESSKKSSSKKKKKKESRGRHSSRGRSQSRGRSASTRRTEKVKNKCKHCKKDRPMISGGQHEPSKCFYNKKYKGWRPSKVCKEMGLRFKHRSEFSSELGGFASSAKESSTDSDSGSESSTASRSSNDE